MLDLLVRLFKNLLSGNVNASPEQAVHPPIPRIGHEQTSNLPIPYGPRNTPPDRIIDVVAYPVNPNQPTSSLQPARGPDGAVIPRPSSVSSRQPRSLVDLIGQIEATPEHAHEMDQGLVVDVTIVYPPDEHALHIRQQQMRAYHWKCSGVDDADVIRKATEAWSSYMNGKYGERSLRLGDVIIISGRHYIIDRIGPQLVPYETAEAWVRLTNYARSNGFELARRNGFI